MAVAKQAIQDVLNKDLRNTPKTEKIDQNIRAKAFCKELSIQLQSIMFSSLILSGEVEQLSEHNRNNWKDFFANLLELIAPHADALGLLLKLESKTITLYEDGEECEINRSILNLFSLYEVQALSDKVASQITKLLFPITLKTLASEKDAQAMAEKVGALFLFILRNNGIKSAPPDTEHSLDKQLVSYFVKAKLFEKYEEIQFCKQAKSFFLKSENSQSSAPSVTYAFDHKRLQQEIWKDPLSLSLLIPPLTYTGPKPK